MRAQLVFYYHRQGVWKMVTMKILLCAALMCQMALGVLSNTADAGANTKTKKIYVAMSNLRGKLLSGAFGGWINCNDYNGFSLGQANGIKSSTSKSPAIYGLDCSPGWATSAPGKEADILECFNNDFAAYGNQGGLLTISAHVPNPVYAGNNNNNWGAFKTAISNSDFANIFKKGHPVRVRWLAILNKIAAGLRKYQKLGHTILFRPFHEMNGEWFWWGTINNDFGNKERMELFKKLWIDTFNFMKRRGLNNLLWVYAADDGRGYKSSFYPGPQYVDFVGLDFYSNDYGGLTGYNEMIALGKPFCLAEVGGRPTDGNFDYGAFVNTVLQKYPKTAYYMSWNAEFSPLTNKGGWAAYNNPRVLNIGQLRY